MVRSNDVKFQVYDAELTHFDLESNNNLHYSLSLNLSIRNSKSSIGIHYDRFEATVYYMNQRLGAVPMPLFYLGSKNTMLLRALFEGQTLVLLKGNERKKFEDDQKTGVYRIDVKLSINFRVMVLHLVTWPMKPVVRCHLKIPLALGSSNSTGGHKKMLLIGQLVKDTSANLREASETDHRRDVAQSKKIADAKLAKDFEAALKEFQKAQHIAVERETSYIPFDPKGSFSSSEVDIGYDRSQEQRVLMESRRQEIVLLDNEISLNEARIEAREQGIQEVKHQISEVMEMFKDLAVMVDHQGTIDDIDEKIDNLRSAAAQGKSHLVKASNTQGSNSSLLFSCSLLLFFFLSGDLCRCVCVGSENPRLNPTRRKAWCEEEDEEQRKKQQKKKTMSEKRRREEKKVNKPNGFVFCVLGHK
ncbi:Target SNARE coiled-coil homology domain [Arabidopsis suecica]|uniref:Target SNARE coiled-coil homology domain n=1 Tax=Arabidopsis suecica TaxID=45249 RepID=A0A8T2HB18_ARASU|nr:Target SNARE coiled-coil homology domain [Arabidopsis suecica]